MMMPGSQSHYTSLFTTISGLIGGLGDYLQTNSGEYHGIGYHYGGLCGEVRYGQGGNPPAGVETQWPESAGLS